MKEKFKTAIIKQQPDPKAVFVSIMQQKHKLELKTY